METYVRLLCPECGKTWQKSPSELPDPARTFHCPGCHASRRLSEFARTERDLQTLQNF
jgi:ssDNA-binding Zn-finger/Zn-ribbon topoisomerase 1